MADYDKYARIDKGKVVVRYSIWDEWGTRGWPPRLAREFALHVIELADKVEQEDPRVLELAEVLEGGPEDENMQETALRLHRAGYRKKY